MPVIVIVEMTGQYWRTVRTCKPYLRKWIRTHVLDYMASDPRIATRKETPGGISEVQYDGTNPFVLVCKMQTSYELKPTQSRGC